MNYVDKSNAERILEGCLLAIISEGEIYGYEMSEKLAKYGFTMASEGSIYPLLIRMQKEGLITSVMKESPSGPKKILYINRKRRGST